MSHKLYPLNLVVCNLYIRHKHSTRVCVNDSDKRLQLALHLSRAQCQQVVVGCARDELERREPALGIVDVWDSQDGDVGKVVICRQHNICASPLILLVGRGHDGLGGWQKEEEGKGKGWQKEETKRMAREV